MRIAEVEPGIDVAFQVPLKRDGAVDMGAFTLPQLQPGRAVDGTKPYQKGDPVRFIDWRSFARTNKLYLREKVESTRIGIEIFVDGGASMAFPDDSLPPRPDGKLPPKLELAMRLGYFLGYEFADLGEQVTLCLKVGNDLTGLIAKCSDRKLIKSHFMQIGAQKEPMFTDAKGLAQAALHPEFTPAPQSRRFRIIISDALTTDIAGWFDRLGGGRGLFIHSLSQLEQNLDWMASDDVYFDQSGQKLRTTGKSFKKYRDQVEQQKTAWLERCEQSCQLQGWSYLKVADGDPVDHFLARFAAVLSHRP